MPEVPARAQVVIVGGGIVGCSIAYHLTLRGVTDVVLLERHELTSGTTWHAAGLVAQLRASHNMTRLAAYSGDLYEQLDADGYPTGTKRTGSIAVANNEERLEELIRGADMAECFGIEVNQVSVEDLAARWPLMNIDDVIGGVHVPRDAQTSPVDTTIALSKAAKANGARIIQGIDVADIVTAPTPGGRAATGVTYRAQGSTGELHTIEAEHVVTAAGLWSRPSPSMCSVTR